MRNSKVFRGIAMMLMIIFITSGCSGLLGGAPRKEGEDQEYVYDYQVSMEAIPADVAALGGPVYGTIHAYPSRIIQELTRQEIKKDGKLNKAFKKYQKELKQYLEEKYGEKFVLTPYKYRRNVGEYKFIVHPRSDESSVFVAMVTEGVIRNSYYDYYQAPILGDIFTDHNINKIKEILGDNLQVKAFCNPFDERVYTVENTNEFFSPEVVASYSIYIAVFGDENIDRIQEQKKITKVWKDIVKQQEIGDCNLFIMYFPEDYEKIISDKFGSTITEDSSIMAYPKSIDALREKGEVKEYIEIIHMFGDATKSNLEKLDRELEKTVDQEELRYWNQSIYIEYKD